MLALSAQLVTAYFTSRAPCLRTENRSILASKRKNVLENRWEVPGSISEVDEEKIRERFERWAGAWQEWRLILHKAECPKNL